MNPETPSKSTELKTCPFCGGQDSVGYQRGILNEIPSWQAGCVCGVWTEPATTQEGAARKWNQRDVWVTSEVWRNWRRRRRRQG